jgi:hypothetical protein
MELVIGSTACWAITGYMAFHFFSSANHIFYFRRIDSSANRLFTFCGCGFIKLSRHTNLGPETLNVASEKLQNHKTGTEMGRTRESMSGTWRRGKRYIGSMDTR